MKQHIKTKQKTVHAARTLPTARGALHAGRDPRGHEGRTPKGSIPSPPLALGLVTEALLSLPPRAPLPTGGGRLG